MTTTTPAQNCRAITGAILTIIAIAIATVGCSKDPEPSGGGTGGAAAQGAGASNDQGTGTGANTTKRLLPIEGASKYPGTEAGAKELLSEFLKSDADHKTLSLTLRPAKADYAAVFEGALVDRLPATYDPAWDAGKLVLAPNPGQTELILRSVPSSEIRQWSKSASDALPGGYEKIKDQIKDGQTIYAFKFVKPGESIGMAFDGLVFVNGHWRIFPKPWRVAE